ncbi:Putative RNA recognition motif domain, nucleotide-binding alpha-beta plait domain superfamily [Septoria linicola]|uniref:RNA recognition motif domain, nucleotide-binding alpha-beta plait domain superfamily n=1 Tax=Septoria linicola TaxID=215465 RepID=A0A9Q9B8R1_9PEZI|nr:putative RNA recognition motif domain, nucleotide-binding alpha-beta plait domain superfamily [Septoria linicola]USW59458.1 Putative RNA recognition motif domain, nucleotide-binding alpha-beta plait domain superfamily [Septoria linicola]
MNTHDTGDSNNTSPEPPEEAWLRSEPALLSPASPKPLHFPQPTSIPVLDKMMDVGFNQAEPHMSNAAMHDTELRPGAWRDPEDQSNNVPSPYSTGGDADDTKKPEDDAQNGASTSHSNETAVQGNEAQSATISNGVSYDAQSHAQAENTVTATSTQEASSDPSTTATEPTTTSNALQSNEVNSSQYQATPTPGAVDVQALLDQLSGSISQAGTSTPANNDQNANIAQSPLQSHADGPSATTVATASPTGLPPRPPPQDQPLINAAYVHSQHIRDYHPHAAHSAVNTTNRTQSTGNAADPQSHAFVPPVATNGSQAPTAYGDVSQNQQMPVSATGPGPTPFSGQQGLLPTQEQNLEQAPLAGTEDKPWTADTQRKYDYFMNEERRYVNEARWDQFPSGSRLFVGNLSSEKVTKRDIFHVFHHYGEIAQISIKQAYGFVQFLRVEDCMKALAVEQGRQIRDKRIHLEISKPQKPPRDKQQNQNQNHGRRSRSPAFDNRGRNDRNAGGRGRGRDGGRNSYNRSPSPRDYGRRHDDRYRTRSRSPGYGRDDRYRGSGSRRSPDHDDLPLPRREPRDVPDIQIIALEGLERDFLSWVEKAFASRGVRVDVLTISARLNEDAVVRRQIVEGVLAVCKLRRHNQDTGRIGLTIFKRSSAGRDVQFEEYDNLDPPICAELVMRERSSVSQPQSAPSYNAPPAQYSTPAQPPSYGYQQPPAPSHYGAVPPGYPPNYGQQQGQYASMPPNAPPAGYPPGYPPRGDPNNLQNLLSTLSTASPHVPSANPYTTPSQPGYPPPQQQQFQPQYQPTPPQASVPPKPPAGLAPPPNMADILARLGTYNRQ